MPELINIFKRINKTGTGHVTAGEIILYFSELSFAVSEKDEEMILNKYGRHGLCFQDFLDIWSLYDNPSLGGDLVEECFLVFDLDADGRISFDDFKKVLTHLGIERSDSQIRWIVQLADKDGDGYVSLDEFKEVLYK